MTGGTFTVMLLGLEDGLARWVVVALSPLGVLFDRLPWPAVVAKPHWVLGADAVVMHHQGDRTALDWLSELGGWSADGVRAGAIVVLCNADQVDEVESLHGWVAGRAVLIEDSGERLRDVVGSLLAAARRVRLQVPVRLMSTIAGDRAGTTGSTENLSMSGMLMSCDAELRIGSTFQFELSAPGREKPIRGLTKVVRRADPTRDGIRGVGARFLSVLPSDRDRFESWLSNEIH